jgi:hypothetical protein
MLLTLSQVRKMRIGSLFYRHGLKNAKCPQLGCIKQWKAARKLCCHSIRCDHLMNTIQSKQLERLQLLNGQQSSSPKSINQQIASK